jgi:predicted phosphodiesterase
MRLAILSDIHGNLKALEAVLADLKQQGAVDKTWVLGDLAAFGPRPAECIQLVKEIPNVQVIGGNTDRYLVTGQIPASGKVKSEPEYVTWIDKFRQEITVFMWTLSKLSFKDHEYLSGLLHQNLDEKVTGYGWVLGYHGSPGNDEYIMGPDTPDEEVLDQFLDAGGRLGFGGHTHLPMDRDLGPTRVVNVGSVGFPKDERRACYVIADISEQGVDIQFHRVEYDTGAVIADWHEQEHPAPSAVIEKFTSRWK